MPDPKTSHTLEEFAEAGQSIDLKFSKFCLIEQRDGIEFPVHNVIDDYWDELREMSMEVELNQQEYHEYRFRPRLLCDYIYGNGDLYWIILIINDCINVRDFDKKKIKLIRPTALKELLDSVFRSEKQFIERYNTKDQ